MNQLPQEPRQAGHFNEWLRKLRAFVIGSQPMAGMNIRIERTPDGSIIHANPKFAANTYPLLVCDQSTVPPTRKILHVYASGDATPVDE